MKVCIQIMYKSIKIGIGTKKTILKILKKILMTLLPKWLINAFMALIDIYEVLILTTFLTSIYLSSKNPSYMTSLPHDLSSFLGNLYWRYIGVYEEVEGAGHRVHAHTARKVANKKKCFVLSICLKMGNVEWQLANN